MLIRRIKKEDVAAVYRIEKETFSEPWSGDSFERVLESKSNIYLIAEEKGNSWLLWTMGRNRRRADY